MANHINHYKSLKKNNTKSKREEIPIYPSTLFALFFVLFFSFFCCSFFYNDSIFYSQALLSSDCDVVCCCYRLSNFIQKQFFPHFFYFPLLSRHFLNWFVCVLHFHSHLTLRSCHIIYALFSFFCCSLFLFLCVCSMNTVHSSHNRSYGYKRVHVIHVMTFVQNISTVLYWNRQKLDLMELLHL